MWYFPNKQIVFVWRQVSKLTVETVHLQHHVSLLSVGRPLQQGQRVSA